MDYFSFHFSSGKEELFLEQEEIVFKKTGCMGETCCYAEQKLPYSQISPVGYKRGGCGCCWVLQFGHVTNSGGCCMNNDNGGMAPMCGCDKDTVARHYFYFRRKIKFIYSKTAGYVNRFEVKQIAIRMP